MYQVKSAYVLKEQTKLCFIIFTFPGPKWASQNVCRPLACQDQKVLYSPTVTQMLGFLQ